MLRRFLVGNILLESFDRVFVLIKQAQARSASQGHALGTAASIPAGNFYICEKSHSRETSISCLLHQEGLSVPRRFPSRSGRSRCLGVNDLFGNKGEVLRPFTRPSTGLWAPFSCEIFVHWIQRLIFKKAAVLTLLVFICTAEANGTLRIKLLFCAG